MQPFILTIPEYVEMIHLMQLLQREKLYAEYLMVMYFPLCFSPHNTMPVSDWVNVFYLACPFILNKFEDRNTI